MRPRASLEAQVPVLALGLYMIYIIDIYCGSKRELTIDMLVRVGAEHTIVCPQLLKLLVCWNDMCNASCTLRRPCFA